MQVGDLVKLSEKCFIDGCNDDVWYGIITKEKPVLKTKQQGNPTFVMKYLVEWTIGDQGWFFPELLEAV